MKVYLYLFLLLFPLNVFSQKYAIQIAKNKESAEFVYDSIEFKDNCTIIEGYFIPFTTDYQVISSMDKYLETENKVYHLLYSTLLTKYNPIKSFRRGIKYRFQEYFEPISTSNNKLSYIDRDTQFYISLPYEANKKTLSFSTNTIDSLLSLKRYSDVAFAINKIARKSEKNDIEIEHVKYIIDKYKVEDLFLNCHPSESKIILRLFENTLSILHLDLYHNTIKQLHYIDSIQDSIDLNIKNEDWDASVMLHKILLSSLREFGTKNKSYERLLVSYRKSLINSGQYDSLSIIDKKIIEVISHNYDNNEEYLNRLCSAISDYQFIPNIREGIDSLLWENIMLKSINSNHLLYAKSLKYVATHNLQNNKIDVALNQFLTADSILALHSNNKDTIVNINSHIKINYKWERNIIKKYISQCYFNKNDLSNALKYDSCNIYYNFKNNDTAKVVSLCKQEYLKSIKALNALSRSPIILSADSYYSYTNFDWIFSEALYSDIPYYAYMTNNPELCSLAFNGSLITKGFRLYNEIQVNKYINTSKNPELKKLSDKLKLEIQDYYNGNNNIWEIIHLRLKIINYLNELKFFDNNIPEWNDIKNSLSDDEIAIEFFEVPFKEKGTTFYFAMTLKNNYNNPHIILIGKHDILSHLIDIESYSNGSIFKIIWKPFMQEFQGVNKVYFSPAGLLNYIAIENCDSLIEGKELYRLSSTKELINKNQNDHSIKKAYLFGGLLYNMPENLNCKEFIATRGSLNDISISTQNEVDNITSLLTNQGIKCQVYNGYEGTEQAFKKLSGKQIDLLHIASHGYYKRLDESNRNLSTLEQYYDGENKLLLRSGLLLAKAKDAIDKDIIEDDKDDGILTASEISKLNLFNIKLVILSACNTGLGDLLLSEGIYGLQRAFKKAGVKSILMTLWEVDNIATELFMADFYKYYLQGESIRGAFRKAQINLKNYKDEMNIKCYSAPEYWAPFILLDAI